MKIEGEDMRLGCYANIGSRFEEVAMPTEEAGLGRTECRERKRLLTFPPGHVGLEGPSGYPCRDVQMELEM